MRHLLPRPPLGTKALVVYAHPDPTSFTAAARDRAVAALERRGAAVEELDLYGEGFDPISVGVDPTLLHHRRLLRWCNTLVLVYPTWWSAQPAILKGWFDRVWTVEGGPMRVPNVRRLVILTSHGSGWLTNLLEGRVGKRTVGRALRSVCHPLARTTWRACYHMDRNSFADRERFLARLDSL